VCSILIDMVHPARNGNAKSYGHWVRVEGQVRLKCFSTASCYFDPIAGRSSDAESIGRLLRFTRSLIFGSSFSFS